MTVREECLNDFDASERFDSAKRLTSLEKRYERSGTEGGFMLLSGQRGDVMSATDRVTDGMTEHCDQCQRETPHDVSVQILTESSEPTNSEYSREPYRVSECRICGDETVLRMNNA